MQHKAHVHQQSPPYNDLQSMAQNALVYRKKAAKDGRDLFGNGWELD